MIAMHLYCKVECNKSKMFLLCSLGKKKKRKRKKRRRSKSSSTRKRNEKKKLGSLKVGALKCLKLSTICLNALLVS